MVMLGQRYTAQKESASVDYSAAVGEMTGQLGQLVKNVDADTANQVLDFVRDKLDSGALDSREGLKDAPIFFSLSLCNEYFFSIYL